MQTPILSMAESRRYLKTMSTTFVYSTGPGQFVSASTIGVSDKNKADALLYFLLDNNDPSRLIKGNNANDGEAALTFAITAGQGLNDTQKADVQNYLFVFEEFYKSASAILQSITQMIEKMAQNISR